MDILTKFKRFFLDDGVEALTFRQACDLFAAEQESRGRSLLPRMAALFGTIAEECRTMETIAAGLRDQKLDAPYKPSELLKNRFCERTIAQIRKLELPASELEAHRQFIAAVRTLIGDLTMTPKQAMHLKFFFGAEMKSMAEHLKRVEAAVAGAENLLQAYMEPAARVEQLLKELASREVQAGARSETIKRLDAEYDELEKARGACAERLGALGDVPVRMHQEERMRLVQEMSRHEQYILSEVGGVTRLLKKYFHKKHLEDAHGYLADAVEAVRSDTAGVLRQHLADAIQLAETGRLEIEARHLDRAKELLAAYGTLIERKNKLEMLGTEIARKDSYVSERVAPLAAQKRALEEELGRLERQCAANRQEKARAEEEKEALRHAAHALRADVCAAISGALGMKLQISDAASRPTGA